MELKGKHLSASMINTFLECPRKFQKRYVERFKLEKATDHLPLGTAFHAAMEAANNALKEGGPCEQFTEEQREEFLQIYRRLAIKLGLSNMSSFDEGIDLVEKALDRMSTNKTVLGVEVEFSIITPDGVPIMGFIDSIEQLSDTELLVNDYKTSRIAKSTEEARGDIQLAMYDYAASIMYPGYKTIWVQLDYIRHDKPPVRIKRTREQRQSFLKYLKSVYDEILAFEPNPDVSGRINQNCAYCDYNSFCEQYTTLINSFQFGLDPVESMIEGELVDQRERLNNAKKAIEARLGQVNLEILTRMERSECGVRSETKEVYIMQGTTREQDVPTVVNNIPLDELVSYGIIKKVNTKGLDVYFKDNPNKKLQSLIDNNAVVKFNNPSVRTKNIK